MRMNKSLLSWLLVFSLLLTCLCLSACSDLDELAKPVEKSYETEESLDSSDEKETYLAPSESTIKDELVDQADRYMRILLDGDVEETCNMFGYRRDEILFLMYDNNALIYNLIFSRATYFYGSAITDDHQDYSLDVTINLPDLKSCVAEVLADYDYMYTISKDWVNALNTHGDDQTAHDNMIQAALEEAMRRISEGEYSGNVMYTDYFTFHKNPDGWLCTKTPDFVTLMGNEMYMRSLTYIDATSEFYLLDGCVSRMVLAEEISVEDATRILEERLAQMQEQN
ncbi:MAG: hypothetical protein J6Y08_02475 [Clostridiales bacterium]|nr:hypothetical protein [Clostridiales bacterium]